MEILNTFEYNGAIVTDSKEVAKFLGVRHEHVMRTIKRIANGLSGQEVTDKFIFITKNGTFCAYMTQKGCELFADVRSRGSRTNKTMNERFISVCKELFQESKPQTAVQNPPTTIVTVPESKKDIYIAGTALRIKEYKGQRVVTFKDIDEVHKRPEGTASRNFKANRSHFIEGEDYYIVKSKGIQIDEIRLSEVNNRGTIFITESGYLMLVKSFTDDLAWSVQRQLVNSYFRVQQIQRAVDSYMIEDPIERAKRWIQEQEEKKALAVKVEEQNQQIEKQNEQIAELSPKAEYCDKVLQTSELVTITDIAKDFGKSAVWLNKKLHERKVQFKQGGIWHLYQGYAEKGYAVTKTTVTEDRNGKEHSRTHTYWTQRGKKFIFDLLAEENIFPVTMQEQIIMIPLLEQEEVTV